MPEVAALGWELKFLVTLPLVWLIIIGLLDYYKGFSTIFFTRTLKRIHEKQRRIRSECTNGVANCPIYKVLLDYWDSSHTDYAKEVGKIPIIKILKDDIEDEDNCCVIWSLIRGMAFNYQQAAFFEVIVIQFFIAFLVLEAGLKYVSIVPVAWSDFTKYIYLAFSILFFLGPWLVQTYVYQENITSYTNVKYRLVLITCTWIIMMLL